MPDESSFDHHKRIVYGKLIDKTLADIDYAELAKPLYGQAYSSDTTRKMMYGSKKTLDLIDSHIIDSIGKDDVLSELVSKKRDIEKERNKLYTERLEYNRWIREDARDELFMDRVIDAIRENLGMTEAPEDIPIVHGTREAALCLADMHFGKEFKIYGLRDEVLNEYSPEIFYARMEKVLSETRELVEKENINTLRVYNLGDSVEGFIRNSQLWSLRWGVIDSAIIFGDYMGNWLRRLSGFVNVVYAQTDGNHDELRLLDGKKGQHLCESAGKIIRNIIRIKNEDNPNFSMIENRTGLIYDELCGYSILGVHGEVKDRARAIQEYSDVYDVNISYLFTGHIHHEDVNGCGARKACIGVGSVIGSDDFSMLLRRRADASASLVVFETGKGKVIQYTYVLD